jgi:hypothetical protein
VIGRILLACAAAAVTVAVLLAVSGGTRITVGGLRISARSPLAPSIAAAALLGAWGWMASRRGRAAADLAAMASSVEKHACAIVIGLAAASAGMAIAFGTFAAAGADASGYLSQAAMWTTGRLGWPDPLPLMPGWPADAGISAPLGWHAASERGWQVPTYGPGLPLLMALPLALGGPLAASVIVAVSAAAAVAATAAIASRLSGWTAAILAAVALLSCPVFIFQSTQPMSDVPVAAAWVVCWALLLGPRSAVPGPKSIRRPQSTVQLRRAFFSGVGCAVAILIRPNLAPLAIVPVLYVLFSDVSGSGSPSTAPGTRGAPGTPGAGMARAFVFALPVALAGLMLACLQWVWYGSPLRSGYGTVEQLYSFAHVAPNLWRYFAWLLASSPVLLLAMAGLWIRRGPLTRALAAFAALNLAAYLVYFVFSEWSYLRFLLPALAIGCALTAVALAALFERADPPARVVLLFAAALIVAGLGLSRARALDVFKIADAHRRVLQIDRYLDSALPPHAVVIAGEQSGAVRFDTGRPIVRWEAASPDDLARVLSLLEAGSRPVWVVLDAWEEPLVRAKFGGLAAAALDWPPVVDAGDAHRTRAWSLSDRVRYLKGARIVTDRLR